MIIQCYDSDNVSYQILLQYTCNINYGYPHVVTMLTESDKITESPSMIFFANDDYDLEMNITLLMMATLTDMTVDIMVYLIQSVMLEDFGQVAHDGQVTRP